MTIVNMYSTFLNLNSFKYIGLTVGVEGYQPLYTQDGYVFISVFEDLLTLITSPNKLTIRVLFNIYFIMSSNRYTPLAIISRGEMAEYLL